MNKHLRSDLKRYNEFSLPFIRKTFIFTYVLYADFPLLSQNLHIDILSLCYFLFFSYLHYKLKLTLWTAIDRSSNWLLHVHWTHNTINKIIYLITNFHIHVPKYTERRGCSKYIQFLSI